MKRTPPTLSLIQSAVVFATVAALLSLTAGCSKKTEQKQGPRTVPIKATQAVQKDVPVQVSGIGAVEAFSTVQVKSLVGGELKKVHFTEGQDVKKDDILFTIDPRPFDAALKQAESTLAKNLAMAKNAELDAKRAEDLMKSESTSQQQYDEVRAKEAAAHAQVAADRAMVDNAKLNLEYCTIKSPVDGRTGVLMMNEGNVVKANDVALVTINQLAPIYVTFSIPERHLGEIRKQMAAGELAVQAIIPNFEGAAEAGKLSFIDNSVDRATGTIKLKGTFDNEGKRLWPGAFVNFVITLSKQSNAVVVPSQVVQTGQQGQYVYVVKPDEKGEPRAEFRPVVAGVTVEGETVIEKGLAAGETVVTDGHLQLLDKTKVQIKGAENEKTEKTKTVQQ